MKRPLRVAGWIGLGVIVMSLVLLAVNPREAVAFPEGFFSPIVAFEFAKDVADLQLLFGAPGSSAQQALIADFDLGNRLDYAYMLLYGAFLAAFGITSARLTGSKLGYVAAALAVTAVVGDALENVQLLAITAAVRDTGFTAVGDLLVRLRLFTWLKWGSLAVAFLALIPFLGSSGVFGRFAAAVAALPFVLGVFAYFRSGLLNEIFALSVAVVFLLLIVFCWIYRGPDPAAS